MLDELPLDPAIHDRQGFECCMPALDEYVHRFAEQHRKRGIRSIYVLTEPAQPERVLGYYTLSAAEVDRQRLTELECKKLPRFPAPCFRMGRLGCRTQQRATGLGKLPLACAVDRCLKARQLVAAYALVVEAKDGQAKAFCAHFGFKSLQDAPLALYLPLGR